MSVYITILDKDWCSKLRI